MGCLHASRENMNSIELSLSPNVWNALNDIWKKAVQRLPKWLRGLSGFRLKVYTAARAIKSTVFQKCWNKWWNQYLDSFTELSSTTMLSITTVSLPSGSFPSCARLKVFDTLRWPRFATSASRDVELTGMITSGAWIETFKLILELWVCKLWI